MKMIFKIVFASAVGLWIASPAVASTPETDELTDSIETSTPPDRIIRLTEDDYREVAEELGVETAAIKAVVDIEAGKQHQGFFAPGKPLVNFDLSMFRQFARKNGINLSRYSKSHSTVFASPNARRYGSTQAAQQERLRLARTIDNRTGIEGTFWGMFQIGGFNWKLCGCSNIEEFVEKMSRSERDQLELFAQFIKNSGMLPALKSKNWAQFARRYNGASYASRGYHTRMASAYARHKALESKSTD
ncbi:MAG: N-acetylmuramidase family protein [Bacteroides sp.]|nr:N-acetylmuramidase family protein [Bacteroides sp.]MCM1414255.1 N-acetylmuramidase family protein [Bacteroides sp.]MCM1471210.1 N-acetylmuramidase family protein [Bacteroides sp.]